MKTLLCLLSLCVFSMLAGCQRQEELSVADALGGIRVVNWRSIACDKAEGGKRQCSIKYEWADDSTSKVEVQVDPVGFPGDNFKISWDWEELSGGYWRSDFSTSIDLKVLPRGEVLPWVSTLSQLVAAQAEIVAKDELAAARKRQEVWKSYRSRN